MPISAALVHRHGEVITTNRWLDAEPGSALLTETSSGHDARVRFGVDHSRWRVRPLDEAGEILLATAERADAGDHLLRQFFSSGDALFVGYDQGGLIIESNAAWERLLGYSSDEIFGVDSWSLLPDDEQIIRSEVEEELRVSQRAETTFHMRTADGSYRLVRWALHFDASVGRCFGIGRDVTEEGKLTAELEHKAFHDQLTGLDNRVRLVERLETVLAEGGHLSLLFCDLDRFKIVNDSLGHQAGDQLLTKLSRRLAGVDLGADALLSRFGGDEFVVLLESGGVSRARLAAVRLLDSLEAPFDVKDRSIHVTMSIGISAAAPNSHRTAESLLGDADTAAYEAKSQGRKRWVVFDERLRSVAERRFDVESGLRIAIADGSVAPLFQPIVSIESGEIIGAEALVRWHTDEGILAPGAFLDVAQDAGLLPDIGNCVIDATIEAATHFAAIGRPMLMSINLSDPELKAPRFCDDLADRVRAAGLDPDSFLIEITESAVLATDPALPVLRRLRNAGFHLGLDDFGTGFSSLAHLRELPIDVVKVDRSFVSGLVNDPVTQAVTASLVDLCQALDLTVIMEGIETDEQSNAVQAIGGTIAQGYLFHRPMPIEELTALVSAPATARA